MPAHIYSMAGLWEDSITSNLSALEIQPDYYHAADFTVYAHLQLAQDAKAAAMIDKALKTPERGDRPATLGDYTARAAMPARYVLERADWAAAAALPVTPTAYPQADSLTRFTRGAGHGENAAIAAARSSRSRRCEALAGGAAEGRRSVLGGPHAGADARGVGVGGARRGRTRQGGRAHAQRRRRRRWQPQARGDGEPPLPDARIAGDLLLEAGQPAAALAEYMRALKQTPNRFRGLYGAARAAEALGDRENAADYYRKLILLAKKPTARARRSRGPRPT